MNSTAMSDQIDGKAVSQAEPAEPVGLPATLTEFQSKLSITSIAQSQALAHFQKTSLKVEEQQVAKYSGTALLKGRPLDRVMIIMAGQSGAGKSTTINILFGDEVCPTSTDRSETQSVEEYGKVLTVTRESPPLKGTLSFIDVPGSLDVDQNKEALNLSAINKFISNHEALSFRPAPTLKGVRIKKTVFPNLVLMTIKAGDNRMVGKDSHLQMSLETLRNCSIVDPEINNLLVVVTHALSLGINQKRYREKSNKMSQTIRDGIKTTLGVDNVKIVFVENSPEDYDLVKDEDSDFYSLPDGELSHHNLIMAMFDHFNKADDYLASLFCGWYFSSSCPDKQYKPRVLKSVGHSSLSPEDIKLAKSLGRLKIAAEKEEDEAFPAFEFEFIGRGYDPKTESTKNVNVYAGNDTTHVEIHGKKYTIPTCLKVVRKNENYFHQLSCATQDSYVSTKLAKYGLEADVNLVVKVDSKGRWVKDSSSTDKKSVVTMLNEIRLANVRMDEPENNMKDQLGSALKDLEIPYSDSTAFAYNEFFSKWGTHIICEVSIGGYIEVNCVVNTSTFNEKESFELQGEVRMLLKGNTELAIKSSDTKMQSKHLQDQTLVLSGGDPPDITSLTELTAELKTQWVESLKTTPTELKHSFKLYPYYNMVGAGDLRTSLRDATVDYLADTMIKKLPKKRDETAQAAVDSAVNKGGWCTIL